MIKAVVFDLDYTLHNDDNYWLGSFREMASLLKKEEKIEEKKTFQELKNVFNEKKSTYAYIFDDVLEKLKINRGKRKRIIKEFIKIYRGHIPSIKLYSDSLPILEKIRKKYKTGLITNGKWSITEKKLKFLGLSNYFDAIVCQEGENKKPNKNQFIKMVEKLGIREDEMIYIGDHPEIDFSGLSDTKIKTVRILRGQFKEFESNNRIDYKIKNLKELDKIIELQ